MAKHAVMPSSLAKALMEAGVQHFDTGGTTQGGIAGWLTPQNDVVASAPNITKQNFQPQINTLQKQNADVYGQQQNLAQALLARSQGTGPNPAQAALNQQTGNNIAGTAALMAGVRGGNSNPGLIARQVGQVGATTQQQAVGQAATLQAEQELAAQKQLQDLYNSQASASLQGQGIEQGALAAENSASTTGELGASQINAQTAQANTNNVASTAGGLISGVGSILGKIFYKGGKVQNFADGGIASYATPVDPRVVLNVNSTDAEGKAVKGAFGSIANPMPDSPLPTTPTGGTGGVDPSLIMPGSAETSTAGGLAGGQGEGMMQMLQADPQLLMLAAAHGGEIPGTDFRSGGPVPGKAKVSGDSPANDVVPAILSPGEDVLPRSVTQAPDAPERAKRFVEALRDRKGDSNGYGKVLKAKATLKDRVARLEKLCAGGMA